MTNLCRRLLLMLVPVCATAIVASIRSPAAEPAGTEGAPLGKGHALLVGCTEYPSLIQAWQLYGPANDVVLMRDLLKERYKFADDDITVLSQDAQTPELRPTRANIEREFHRLADPQRVDAGDRVVILLAGHGSQQPNDDPDNANDPELDGYDEIFLPADIGAWDGGRQCVPNSIRDDELRVWLQAIRDRGAFVWVIVDACHSGTMIRGAGDETLRQVPPEELVPEKALEQARQRAAAGAESPRGVQHDEDSLDLGNAPGGIVALYAAQSNEATVEKPLPPDGEPKRRYGLLTYTINQVLAQATTALTYRELAQRVHAQYTRWDRTSPTPLLEGTHLDREILGQRDWIGRSHIRLSRSSTKEYLIDAGALHGMTKGSILEVRPPAGDPDVGKVVGHVSIQRVEALRCAVVPCAYADLQVNTDLPDGGDCRLVFEDYGEIRLRLAVDPRDIHDHPAPAPNLATASAVLEQLQANEGSFVEIAGPGSPIDWLVRIGDGQVYLVPASGWTAPRGADAKAAAPPLFGPAPLDDKLAEWLGDRLRRIARVHNLLKLATDESGSLVHAAGGVDIMIELLQYADAKATDFKVVPWNNGQILRTGEIVGFRVTNNSQEAVDLTLLHVDSDYSIRSYFPRAGFADNRVRPRESIIKRFRATPADGPEHMVAIAVRAEPQREPMSFSCLEQDAIEQAQVTRGGPQSLDSPLGKLLQSALFAKGQTRGLDDVEVDSHTVRQLTWRVIPAGN